MNGQNMPRRNFMIRAIIGIIAFVGAAAAIPLAGFGILPVLRRRDPGWSDAGLVKELAAGVPQERRFAQTVKNGWQEEKVERTVWLVQKPDGSIAAFAPACPHLGCGYRWFPAEKRFKCPCHASVFDIDGKVLAGPAPRPLDGLETRVEDGRVFVKFQIFQVGTATKVAA